MYVYVTYIGSDRELGGMKGGEDTGKVGQDPAATY